MANAKQLIMVGLTQEQWDIVTSVLDGNNEYTESVIKSPEAVDMTREQIQGLKEHANDLVEIMDEIADQLAGVTEEDNG
jgi:predicted HAD superfamily Cof-like phosphohydrolase